MFKIFVFYVHGVLARVRALYGESAALSGWAYQARPVCQCKQLWWCLVRLGEDKATLESAECNVNGIIKGFLSGV